MHEFAAGNADWILIAKIFGIFALLAMSYLAYKMGYQPRYRKSPTRSTGQAWMHGLMVGFGTLSAVVAVVTAGAMIGSVAAIGVLVILMLPPYGLETVAGWWFRRPQDRNDASSVVS